MSRLQPPIASSSAGSGLPRPGPEEGGSASAPNRWTRSLPLTALTIAIPVLVCGAILALRRPDALFNAQFWAEDGTVYFVEAREGLSSILKPHSFGQIFVLQRLIAWALSPVLPRYAPLAYSLAALAGTLLVCGYVCKCRLGARFQWLMALAIVTAYMHSTVFGAVYIPVFGAVYLQLVNLHWILALATVAMAASADPQSRAGKGGEMVALPLLILSGSPGIILAPLFIVRAIVCRSIHSLALMSLAILLAGFATLHLQTQRGGPGKFDVTDPHWLGFLGTHFSGTLFFGAWADDLPGSAWRFLGLTAVLGAWVIIFAWKERDPRVAIFALAAALMLAATGWCWSNSPTELDHAGHRYYFVPSVCLVWCFLLMVARGSRAAVAALFMVLFALSSEFTLKPLQDLKWAEASRCIGGPVACEIHINPTIPPRWWILYRPGAPLTGHSAGH